MITVKKVEDIKMEQPIREFKELEYIYKNPEAFSDNDKNAIDILIDEPELLWVRTIPDTDFGLDELKRLGFITGDRIPSVTPVNSACRPPHWSNVCITDKGKDYIEKLNSGSASIVMR